VQNFVHAVNSAFYRDQLAAGDAWIERRHRIIGWLNLLDASAITLDYEAEELVKVPEVHGDAGERSSTIFDSLDEIVQSEGRERQDRINLQRAVGFYLGAVDQAVRSFTTFVDAREDPAAQEQFAEDTIRQIEPLRGTHRRHSAVLPGGVEPTTVGVTQHAWRRTIDPEPAVLLSTGIDCIAGGSVEGLGSPRRHGVHAQGPEPGRTGALFQLLRTHIQLRPALTEAVAFAELHLDRTRSAGTTLIFYPFLPWPWPQAIGAHLAAGDPDTLWLMPRALTVGDF
jgi:hypothetical protein